MDILEIINNKYNGLELHKSDVEAVILGYADSKIDDNAMKKFLEAIYKNSMTEKEIADFVDVLIHSEKTLEPPLRTIARYSSDTIMDGSTLILTSLLSSMGVKILNISDDDSLDLENTCGLKLNLSDDEIIKQMDDIKAVFTKYSDSPCLLNKKIFDLAVSNNIVSLPLVIINNLCKLLISNSNVIVFDIKIGLNSYINNLEDAKEAADIIMKIGSLKGKRIICVLSNRDIPLGRCIGGSLELLEVEDTLKGHGTSELNEYIINLGSLMLSLDKDTPIEESIEYMENALENSTGYDKFKSIIEYQKGNLEGICVSNRKITLKSLHNGYISNINLCKLNSLAKELGMGDNNIVNNSVGFKLHKTVGDYVTKNDELITVYYKDHDLTLNSIYECFKYTNEKKEKQNIIFDIIK